jgi:ankyrin repeat protein
MEQLFARACMQREGSNCLRVAACSGSLEVVKMLLDAGVTSKLNAGGDTPLDIAKERGHNELAPILTLTDSEVEEVYSLDRWTGAMLLTDCFLVKLWARDAEQLAIHVDALQAAKKADGNAANKGVVSEKESEWPPAPTTLGEKPTTVLGLKVALQQVLIHWFCEEGWGKKSFAHEMTPRFAFPNAGI